MTQHIALRVEGLVFSYRFNESDLSDEMSKFGKVNEVMLLDEELAPDIAIAEFADSGSALLAVQSLDYTERKIEGYPATIRAVLMTPDVERQLLVKAHILSQATDPFEGSKYTCRYVIGADKISAEYSVIGRIVGLGGENVKSIFRLTGAHVRINGKHRSLDDPLHVRVSAETKESFEAARAMAEKLIQQMYDDYAVWCERHYIPVPAIRLKVIEGSDALRPLGRMVKHFFK